MTVFERLESLKGQLDYVTGMLDAGGLELWDAKEYLSLESDYIKEIAELEDHISEHNLIQK